MCGICGAVNIEDISALHKMNETMSHRGPDDRGIAWFDSDRTGLAHRRLSIIDLSPAAHQPMSVDDGALWITFNGEIYNYLEIRKELLSKGYNFKSNSDTEVILYSYKTWGVDCLHRFNGMFAFAIWDKEKKELFGARDRQGIKPFYYALTPTGLIFASEIKALLASGMVEKEPDYAAIISPTRFQISPYTGFKYILKLPPGHYFVFSDGRMSVKAYWHIQVEEDPVSSVSARAKLDHLLTDAVRLQMIADVPVGIFLSGGLDSSVIAALMRKNTNKEIHSFTIKFSDADKKFEKMVDDGHYAKIVAERFGFTHHELVIQPNIVELLPKLVYHLDEPLADPAAINTYLIAKTARDNGIIVTLNGMGGDEIFGGYRKQLASLMGDWYLRLSTGLLRDMIRKVVNKMPVASEKEGYKSIRWMKRFLSFASLPQYERYLASDQSLSKDAFESLFNLHTKYEQTYYYKSQRKNFSDDRISYLTKMCLNDTTVFLPEHNLTYSDKATMAASVEGRPPLTDHRIIEFMFSIPPSFRIHGTSQKYLLKSVSRKYLSPDLIKRPKAPFGSPLRAWIRGPLKPMVDDYLSEHEVKKRDLWNYAYVKKLVDRDREGLEDNAFYIYQLLTMQVWFETFFH